MNFKCPEHEYVDNFNNLGKKLHRNEVWSVKVNLHMVPHPQNSESQLSLPPSHMNCPRASHHNQSPPLYQFFVASPFICTPITVFIISEK
jgi:hypothetical protein